MLSLFQLQPGQGSTNQNQLEILEIGFFDLFQQLTEDDQNRI